MLFAVTFAALFAAHSFGDHWVQRHGEALAKGAPGMVGIGACLRHVIHLTGTKAVFLMGAVLATGTAPVWWAAIIALAVDAASHYWADRAAFHPDKNGARVTLEALADRAGKRAFWGLGRGTVDAEGRPVPTLGTGAYALDQSFHVVMLFVAALIMEVLS